ncbi:sugar kinase [Chelatococcus sp. SYSU_G07232]|uniref:Sugar kinase n=1 Tax=Chelatococcus albus TaxID=3047466 RepID=A0ABT7AHW6_9HYPH|nr:sugar kinase [Chelatococcus sp. SYSU_G07232]MDJ1158972.1 sugar kinase [Chelatococcus sp. SYSU_G07232]
MSAFDIVAFGEPLMEFAEVERGGEKLYLPGFGGDTSNVAVAAARQGAKVAVFTAVGDDAFGRDFMKLWDAEGIDRSTVEVRAGERTGIYFIGYGPEGHVFSYYRAGSAASLVTPAEVPLDLIGSARVLHVSGISQAISTSACDAVFAAIRHARAKGVTVSYDTNLRLRLWPLDRARAVIHAAVAMSDIARPGLDDARALTGLERPEDVCDFYLGLGCRIVALTLGKEGTMIAVPGERRVVPGKPVKAVDATGAGDTFGGAFLAEWLRCGDPFAAATYANGAAALSTLGHGAVAPMPRRAAVEEFLRAA